MKLTISILLLYYLNTNEPFCEYENLFLKYIKYEISTLLIYVKIVYDSTTKLT